MRPGPFTYLTVAAAAAGIVFILLPLFIMAATAFNPTAITFPPEGFTLKWFGAVLEDARFVRAIIISLVLAVFSAAVSSAIGLIVALAIRQSKSRIAEHLSTLMLSPLFIPGALLGIALYQGANALFGTVPLGVLLVGHILLTLPFPVRALMAGLARIPTSLEEAAFLSGAGFLGTVWHVLLPQLRLHLFAGSAMAFTMSWNDFDLSLFLSGTRVQTLPVEIYGRLQLGADPSITALSLIVALVSVAGVIILDRTIGVAEFAGMERQGPRRTPGGRQRSAPSTPSTPSTPSHPQPDSGVLTP
ncbi:ABC transporter permease [Brevibacterium sp.]|uniref:ABC transporter permease n=1 Tax=Brevibacterium sp. TaxID=1701 RepID=UPI002810AFFC|nr:ABC transporter permease [Brevibacterium sp.]